MLRDMVRGRGVRPGHGGILSGAAKAKRGVGGQLPRVRLTQKLGWFLKSAFCPLGFRLNSSQGSVH